MVCLQFSSIPEERLGHDEKIVTNQSYNFDILKPNALRQCKIPPRQKS